jgi:SAM-dependent methyltransferase
MASGIVSEAVEREAGRRAATGSARAPLPPIFMFGFERSGTTLLSMMVGAHPEIAVPLTVTGMWYRFAQKARAAGLETQEKLERLVDELLAEERIRLWDVVLTRDEVLHRLEPGSYAAVVERFHQLYARRKDKPYWGNLDIATLDEMDEARRWFPDARFLHIVRDGRDVALSHETMPYGASNTLEAAETWNQRLRTNFKMGAMLGPEQYKVIRYEDLISDSESTLRAMCQFFGVRYSEAMLDYPKMVDEKVPKERRWLWPALDKPPDRSKVSGWKARMGETKRVVFEGAAGPLLAELGYEVYGRVPKKPLAYLYELWCFLGRGGRFKRIAARLRLNRPSRLERSWRKSGGDYQSLQKDAFGSLVRTGVYDSRFEHAPHVRAFFEDCMRSARSAAEAAAELRVLDCGCGPGAWLEALDQLGGDGRRPQLYGFDLTPEMVETARARLSGKVPPSHLQQGDILAEASYVFSEDRRPFDILYAFDVVQQLPRKLQFAAVEAMLQRLSASGCAVIFDHDRWSPHGLRMGFRKLVTKYLGIELVPRYYCNARYPALSRFSSRLNASGRYSARIQAAPDGKKRALVVRLRPEKA